ncbi:unnamed protein product [Timema podura]|uniref:Secreted protein n=1 Tax=Timema podura TaxID=61482 RepID=A0ABN7NCW8_TIMPD|nr:unnamed protein product [Timema podura]
MSDQLRALLVLWLWPLPTKLNFILLTTEALPSVACRYSGSWALLSFKVLSVVIADPFSELRAAIRWTGGRNRCPTAPTQHHTLVAKWAGPYE